MKTHYRGIAECWDISGLITGSSDPLVEYNKYREVFPAGWECDELSNDDSEFTLEDIQNYIYELHDNALTEAEDFRVEEHNKGEWAKPKM